MAVFPRVNSDPGSQCWATAVPLTPPAAAAGHPHSRAQAVQLGSKIWKVGSAFDYITCQSSQRQPATHSESKNRVSVQFQLKFTVPSSTKEPPSDEVPEHYMCHILSKERQCFTSQVPRFYCKCVYNIHRMAEPCMLQVSSISPAPPHHYMQWKRNSPQLAWSKFPVFMPPRYHLYARRLSLPNATVTELQRHCASSACRPQAAATWKNFKL